MKIQNNVQGTSFGFNTWVKFPKNRIIKHKKALAFAHARACGLISDKAEAVPPVKINGGFLVVDAFVNLGNIYALTRDILSPEVRRKALKIILDSPNTKKVNYRDIRRITRKEISENKAAAEREYKQGKRSSPFARGEI